MILKPALAPRDLILVDDNFFPRYWASVWQCLHGSTLATSTCRKKLQVIDSFCQHTDKSGFNIDDMLTNLDLERICSALEAFFVSLRNVPNPTANLHKRWRTAFAFVRDTYQRIAVTPSIAARIQDARERVRQLDNLFEGLRPFSGEHGVGTRVIPKEVLSELFDIAEPGSPKNPFKHAATQWRAYAYLLVLIFAGLRKGEALSASVDFCKSRKDELSGTTRWTITVTTNDQVGDTRAETPSIKTAASLRTIPVSDTTGTALKMYVENYRGKPPHKYFFNSAKSLPLSLEGATHILHRLTDALSQSARQLLKQGTGASTLQAHSCRHTCAHVRATQWLAKLPEDKSMQNLRRFFGWSKESTMPLLYCRSALENRINDTWSDEFDTRVSWLRSEHAV